MRRNDGKEGDKTANMRDKDKETSNCTFPQLCQKAILVPESVSLDHLEKHLPTIRDLEFD